MQGPAKRSGAARGTRLLWVSLLLSASVGWAAAADADPATALRERHAALRDVLAKNAFQRPIALESTQASGQLKGEIHAVVEYPFETVSSALKGSANWCDIMILHLNTKDCRPTANAAPSGMQVRIGKKYDQPLEEAFLVEFSYRLVASTPELLQVQLNADNGPLGTRDYRIVLEAIPLDARRSFLHMSYSYGFGAMARMMMQGYLNTFGRGKVGFSVTGRESDGQPIFVDSMRGVVERNTMRYYLAIDAFLGAVHLAPAEQLDKRLRDWFAATERYPRQLHEMEQADYLEMKKKEVRRQQAPL